MHRMLLAVAFIVSVCLGGAACLADPATQAAAKKGKLPLVEFDVENRQVRVQCEALNVDAPLEFFCCVTGTNEHESVLRTSAKPSDIQIALLAIGLKPGQPLTYSESRNKWLPPEGPPLHMSIEYVKDGKMVSFPAYRWLRNVKTKKSPPAFTWVYTGSRVMPDGKFAADITGYVVSIVNFDLTLIDVPELASSANETLEWERNAELMPKTGTKVWMVIEPVGSKDKDAAPANKPAPTTPKSQAPALFRDVQFAAYFPPANSCATPPPAAPATTQADPHLSDVHVDQQKVDALEKYWQQKVAPHKKALQEAAEAHYKVISDLRREQQRLIDEADRIQRAIDKFEKDYQDMTTPRPEAAGQQPVRMVEIARNAESRRPSRAPIILASAIIPLLLALAIAIAGDLAAGVSLGLFFGPILLITFLAGPLTAGEQTVPRKLLASAALTLGVWVVWLARANLSFFDAMRCGMVLASYVLALAGVAALLQCLGMGPTFAATAVAVLGTAWLTWPVWLSHHLTGPHTESVVHCLAAAHPLMAINGVLFDRFNIWDRYTLAYQQLTTLNQDVLYTLPRSVAWMVIVHAAVAIPGFALLAWRKPRRGKSP